MAKVRKIYQTPLTINYKFSQENFTEFWNSFLESNIGKIYTSIPWNNLVKDLNIREQRVGRKTVFSPQGKIALMFLKSYTQLSDSKLMEQINANYEYQFFCGIEITPSKKIKNYKIISDIRVEIAGRLNICRSQSILAQAWKPFINNTDNVLADATCYETSMRYPTDVKLLWEATSWVFNQIKKINKIIKGRMPRSRFDDQKHKYTNYSKSRKKTYKQTHKRVESLLYLLEKLLGQLSDKEAQLPENYIFPEQYYTRIKTIRTILEQQIQLFDGKEVNGRIVSISKSYIRPIVRGKETKRVEFGAKVNVIQIDRIDFIEHLSFKAFNEGIRLQSSILLAKELFHNNIKVVGADAIYANNANRKYCTSHNIITGFVRKGRASKEENNLRQARKVINIKRSTEMEGAFGKHKNHYSLNRITARTEKTEQLMIFFGIHTANALEIGRRIKEVQKENRKSA